MHMWRRVGYFLGSLFVAVCLAAYPLTLRERVVAQRHTSPFTGIQVSAEVGHLAVRRTMYLGSRPPSARTFNSDTEAWLLPWERQWSVSRSPASMRGELFYRVNARPKLTFGSPIGFPLWMPALCVSLFMYWRWRRGRRRDAVGFDVASAKP
jgi:hypothetical protein